MRQIPLLPVGSVLLTILLAGCGSDMTGPNAGSQGTNAGIFPATASVSVGDIFFQSDNNGSSNPAVDTVAISGTVTWTWTSAATMPHSVQSIGTPSFASSPIQSGSGRTYQVNFPMPGTYQYDCAVHGTLMTGTVVVMPVAPPQTMPTP